LLEKPHQPFRVFRVFRGLLFRSGGAGSKEQEKAHAPRGALSDLPSLRSRHAGLASPEVKVASAPAAFSISAFQHFSISAFPSSVFHAC
jgi:hypothetical protein